MGTGGEGFLVGNCGADLFGGRDGGLGAEDSGVELFEVLEVAGLEFKLVVKFTSVELEFVIKLTGLEVELVVEFASFKVKLIVEFTGFKIELVIKFTGLELCLDGNDFASFNVDDFIRGLNIRVRYMLHIESRRPPTRGTAATLVALRAKTAAKTKVEVSCMMIDVDGFRLKSIIIK